MLINTYNRPDKVFISGKGMKLYDEADSEYLDLVSGIAVNSLGHCHPEIIKTIKKQSEKLLHISNLYHTTEQSELAKKLVGLSDHNKVFFCNSGTEAVEAALKIARKYGKQKGHGKGKILYMKDSFHGRTMGALSVTGQSKYQKEFKPLIGGTEECEFNNINNIIKKMSGACAIIIEPIQGEAGLIKADIKFLKKLRELCDKWNCLLIFDEIQCGAGRSGSFFAYKKFGVIPDIVCMAKGLGGGIPIGAILVNKKADVFIPGDHGTTFGGNALSCAVGNTVLTELIDKGILVTIDKKAELLKEKLELLKKEFDLIKEVRGLGLLQGLKLNKNPGNFIKYALKNNVLLVGAGDNVVRIIPPLNVGEKEIEELYMVLKNIFQGFKGEK
ncbi:acetylornithine/succinylornithine family transaminase [Fusobacteria bacterium ZRK30]|nr:acetylornithine/succinylornithine family transaminase [Fusobacteria bacterium ZRK30]